MVYCERCWCKTRWLAPPPLSGTPASPAPETTPTSPLSQTNTDDRRAGSSWRCRTLHIISQYKISTACDGDPAGVRPRPAPSWSKGVIAGGSGSATVEALTRLARATGLRSGFTLGCERPEKACLWCFCHAQRRGERNASPFQTFRRRGKNETL